MGFCLGGKWCRTQDCKERCKGWFGAQPDIERSCKNACKTNSGLTKDDFLCSGNWIDQQIVFAAYGYDPCAGDNTTIEDYFDPLDDRAREDAKPEKYKDLIIIVAAILLLALAALIYVKMK
ncbi:MAG: hypothetical protein KDC85_21920 [Saprospiraceae bacterium]|nr:hypothetical protein [Saprospiraceae bacterium]MCB9322890.1 hypothetical protein [Lewinellaceae bacterium]